MNDHTTTSTTGIFSISMVGMANEQRLLRPWLRIVSRLSCSDTTLGRQARLTTSTPQGFLEPRGSIQLEFSWTFGRRPGRIGRLGSTHYGAFYDLVLTLIYLYSGGNHKTLCPGAGMSAGLPLTRVLLCLRSRCAWVRRPPQSQRAEGRLGPSTVGVGVSLGSPEMQPMRPMIGATIER